MGSDITIHIAHIGKTLEGVVIALMNIALLPEPR